VFSADEQVDVDSGPVRFNRSFLGVLAAIIIAVSFTTLGMFVGRRAQKVDRSAPSNQR
jgi:hypothetical protein